MPAPSTRKTPASRQAFERRATTTTKPLASRPSTTRLALATAPATTASILKSPQSPAPVPTTLPAKQFTWAQLRGQPGFWRVGKTTDGIWWFITPDGNTEFMNSVTTVQPYQLGRDPLGTFYMSRDYDGLPNHQGNLELWAQRTLQRIYATGFKGLGAWCHPIFHNMPVPMTRDLNIWASAPITDQRLYDAGWLPAAEALVKANVAPFKNNVNLVGYFTDNELDFSDYRIGPSLYFDGLPPDNPNRRQVMDVIRQLWPTPEQFNAAWDAHLQTLDDLNNWKTLPKDPPDTYAHLQSAWLEKLMRDYYRITTELLRRHDPNHLILGIRYAGWVPPEVVKASRDYTDAQSLNYYVSDALLDPQMFNMIHSLSGQPLIIGEYSFHSLDNRSGNRNNIGFSAQVPDQEARADAYRAFTTRIARIPWIIGGDWFQWHDEPPSGRSADGEDANFGIVDVDDREYPLLVSAIQQTARSLNTLHRDSHSDSGKDLWRDDFAHMPTQHAPCLSLPIRLNGELSDWPESAMLPEMRMTQTVGMDRTAFPPPIVYVGWRTEGLYLAAEVFDSDPTGAPDLSRWWTRDAIEFWVSTRPVSPDHSVYTPYCHQFFFLPSDPALNPKGIAGVVGQWHRPGDALKDHLLPHPEIQYNCRILSDRYVVEIFVPASSLHGWDPQQQPNLAFNLTVRNYQHAAAYFWSAPKEVKTQLRPETWGTLILDSPTKTLWQPVDGHNNTLSQR